MYKNKNKSLPSDVIEAEVVEHLDRHRLFFRFSSFLEAQYAGDVRHRILQRVPYVGITSVVFMLVFSILDLLMLPESIAQETVQVRLGITVPIIIAMCSWLYLKPPKFYLLPYSFAFLCASLAVVWIIWRAHSQAILLPYEGLMITMMFGFVVMGLPFIWASTLNAMVLVAYMVAEPLIVFSVDTYVNNVVFLVAMFMAGMVAAWIIENAFRRQFLQRFLLNLKEEQARDDLSKRTHYMLAASHDLRQPLEALRIISHDLCDDVKDPRATMLRDGVEHIHTLFGQILDMTQLHLGAMTLAQDGIALRSFLNSQKAGFEALAAERHVLLHMTCGDISVKGDEQGLARILSNLVNNALDHAQAHTIWISIKQDGDCGVLSVKDDGKGMKAQELERAFEPFVRFGNKDQLRGLGVGLSVVQGLVERMGWSMSVNVTNGCEFIVRMPIWKNKPSVFSESRRVVFLNGHAPVCEQYVAWLRQWGYEVACVTTSNLDLNVAKSPLMVLVNLSSVEQIRTVEESVQSQHYYGNVVYFSDHTIDMQSNVHQIHSLTLSASLFRALVEDSRSAYQSNARFCATATH